MPGDITVFLVLTKDPTRVQGNTEKHYLSMFLSERSQLHVFAPLNGKVPNAENHSLPVKGITGALLINVLFAPYWIYQFYTQRPDIVYCYQNVILPALLGRYVFGTTVAFDIRSDPYDQTQEFFNEDDRGFSFKLAMRVAKLLHDMTLKRADYVFVLSDQLGDSVLENYDVEREKLRLLPLGVDTDRFRPSIDSYDQLSIVYIGSLARYRGIDAFLQAVNQLPEATKAELRIDLYGQGPKEYVFGLIDDVTNESEFEVHWHGLIDHEKLPAMAARSDIAVSPIPPYNAYQVSSPAKVFEYLAMGLPIVASRINPHERILDDGENAVLYNPGSITDFSQKLALLIDDDGLRSLMSKNARESSQMYCWNRRFEVIENTLGLESAPHKASSTNCF